LTHRPFATSFANGIPACDNPTLVCCRRIPPIRLLSFGELTFGGLDQLVVGPHDRIVRLRHFGRGLISERSRFELFLVAVIVHPSRLAGNIS
jgi:hypothetical protein